MSDEITPALTPEEWQALDEDGTIVRGSFEISALGALRLVSYGRADECTALDFAAAPALIAILNDDLEAGHPLKITRQDAQLIRDIAEDYEHRGITAHEELLALAAKLAALLPPEA